MSSYQIRFRNDKLVSGNEEGSLLHLMYMCLYIFTNRFLQMTLSNDKVIMVIRLFPYDPTHREQELCKLTAFFE